MDSWKEVVRPTKKPRSVGPHKSKPEKTTSKKKIRQKNKKFRSVNIQIPEKPKSTPIPEKTRSAKIQVPDPKETRSGEDASTPQRLASVAGHPKNRLYINSGASIHILFNKELLGDIVVANQLFDHKLVLYIKHYDTYRFQ